MKHLFKDWDTLQTRIRQARNVFLFLDYDGTLTPIVSRPELALCPPEVKRHLEKLRDLPGVHLAIVSGRSLEDVRSKSWSFWHYLCRESWVGNRETRRET